MQKKTYISGLDGLRALAALSVFAVHYNQIVRLNYHMGPISIDRLFANGNHGVSLFFSLSGFLLSLPFWRAMASEGPFPSLRAYAVRRMTRILPAYYTALTALVLLNNLWRVPEARLDILLHYTFLFNYTEFTIFSINPPFWTLAVEVQFYMLLPCIFLLIRKIPVLKPWLVIIVLAIGAYGVHYCLMSTVTRIIPWPYSPWLTWIRPYGAVLSHSLPANLPHFLIGVGAAGFFLWNDSLNPPEKTWRTNEAVFWVCLTLTLVLLGTGLSEKIELPYGPYGLPLVPLLPAAMIVAAPKTHIAGKILDGFILRRLGLISYGIYIYHLPCLQHLDRYLSTRGIDAAEHWVLFGCVGMGLTILIATVSYVLIEKPIMRLTRNA